jgi:hypothetical protein
VLSKFRTGILYTIPSQGFESGDVLDKDAFPGERAVEELVGLEGVRVLKERVVGAAVNGDAGKEGAKFKTGKGMQAALQGPAVSYVGDKAEESHS